TVLRLRMPPRLRPSLASSNVIESTFSMVETVCRNVKRWQDGDQYLRWVGSGLLLAESRWNRVHGYREIPLLVKEMELAVLKGLPLRHATVHDHPDVSRAFSTRKLASSTCHSNIFFYFFLFSITYPFSYQPGANQ